VAHGASRCMGGWGRSGLFADFTQGVVEPLWLACCRRGHRGAHA
jgi:hypothetical protein